MLTATSLFCFSNFKNWCSPTCLLLQNLVKATNVHSFDSCISTRLSCRPTASPIIYSINWLRPAPFKGRPKPIYMICPLSSFLIGLGIGLFLGILIGILTAFCIFLIWFQVGTPTLTYSSRPRQALRAITYRADN